MRRFFRGFVVGVATVALLAGNIAMAGSGINGVFNLGVANTVNVRTQLNGSTAGDGQLSVANNSTTANSFAIRGTANANYPALWGINTKGGAGLHGQSYKGPAVRGVSGALTGPAAHFTNNGGGTGVQIDTNGEAPLVVNSTSKVYDLNVDYIDGFDSSDFTRAYSAVAIDSTTPLAAGATRIQAAEGLPTYWSFHWEAVPTTVDGRVHLEVEIELSASGEYKHYLLVSNVGSVATTYKVRYVATVNPGSESSDPKIADLLRDVKFKILSTEEADSGERPGKAGN